MSALLAPDPTHATIGNAMSEGFRAPSKVGICEWAEREIRILKGPERGRFRLSRAPYMREPLEAWTTPGVRDITDRMAAQVGKTTLSHICIGYSMDEDPADAIWVEPTEELAREQSNDRIRPLFHASPGIRAQMTEAFHDQQTIRQNFLRCTLHYGWAKSPASLAGRPVRDVILNEANKFPPFSGKEASPEKLATERNKLYFNKRTRVNSTPTVPSGIVSQRWNRSDKRRYWVPCPHCGEKQVLISQYLKWPHGARADEVRAENLAWYECCHCGAHLTDRDKPRMLAGGEWRAECPHIKTHRGYHLSTLYSPWVPWSEYAAVFLESQHNPADLMNFVNSWEGEDWIEKAAEVTEQSIAALKIKYETGKVPLSAQILTCGIDVQNDCIKYAVRAWGVDDESWLIDYGVFLREKDAGGGWKVDQKTGFETDLSSVMTELLPTQYEHANGSRAQIALAYIDSGYRTADVYKLASRNRHVLQACKGANEVQIDGENAGKLQPRRVVEIEKMRGSFYVRLNTSYYKDMLQGMRDNARKPWHIPDDVDEVYLREVSAEHKKIMRNSKGEGVHVWALREGFRDNHYLDCEVYALAAADQKGFRKLVAPENAPRGPVRRAPIKNHDGRPYFVGNR